MSCHGNTAGGVGGGGDTVLLNLTIMISEHCFSFHDNLNTAPNQVPLNLYLTPQDIAPIRACLFLLSYKRKVPER